MSVVVFVLAGLLVVRFPAFVATVLLGTPRKVAGVGSGVAVGSVLNQLGLGLFKALGFASAALLHSALLLAAALLERQMIFFFQRVLPRRREP
jgi:hypothetical protein